MEKILANLKSFGLSEKEAKVYLAAVEINDSVASEIALKSGLPRTLVYDILKRLIELGIVSYSIKNNKKYFSGANPKELLRILKEKEQKISEILPDLEKIYLEKGVKKPKVQIFEGKEGMKTVMNDIFREGAKEFFSYGSSKSSFAIIPAFMEEWHKERIKRKIYFKAIYNNSPEARERTKTYKNTLKHAEYKFMPIKINSPTANLIYGNKVVLHSWTKDPFAVMIENEEMANNQRKYFEELWKMGKP